MSGDHSTRASDSLLVQRRVLPFTRSLLLGSEHRLLRDSRCATGAAGLRFVVRERHLMGTLPRHRTRFVVVLALGSEPSEQHVFERLRRQVAGLAFVLG